MSHTTGTIAHHTEHGDLEHNLERLRHSPPARKIAFIKGLVDILISLSLFFFPSLFCDGVMSKALYESVGIPAASWSQDPAGLSSFAALLMGCGFAAITAGISESNDAYRTVAALNGSFAITGLLTCMFSPHKHASSFLLLISLQDILWFAALVHFGDFGCMDCLGLSTRGLYVLEERLSRDVLRHKKVNTGRQGKNDREVTVNEKSSKN